MMYKSYKFAQNKKSYYMHMKECVHVQHKKSMCDVYTLLYSSISFTYYLYFHALLFQIFILFFMQCTRKKKHKYTRLQHVRFFCAL